jgi:hypothetical protein
MRDRLTILITCHKFCKWTVKRWRSGPYGNDPEAPIRNCRNPRKVHTSNRREEENMYNDLFSVRFLSIAYLSEIRQPWLLLRKQRDERDPAYNPGLFPGRGRAIAWHRFLPLWTRSILQRAHRNIIVPVLTFHKKITFMLRANEICTHIFVVPPMLPPTWPQWDRGAR